MGQSNSAAWVQLTWLVGWVGVAGQSGVSRDRKEEGGGTHTPRALLYRHPPTIGSYCTMAALDDHAPEDIACGSEVFDIDFHPTLDMVALGTISGVVQVCVCWSCIGWVHNAVRRRIDAWRGRVVQLQVHGGRQHQGAGAQAPQRLDPRAALRAGRTECVNSPSRIAGALLGAAIL